MAARVAASVGIPVNLSAYVQDRGNRADYPEQSKLLFYPLGTEWVLHQGPSVPELEPALITGSDRAEAGFSQSSAEDWTHVQTNATFWEPGEYIIRLRADNFLAPDTRFDNMCCWSNVYVPVTVTP